MNISTSTQPTDGMRTPLQSGSIDLSTFLLTPLAERAGFGWYQVVAAIPLVGVLVIEGAEMIVTSSVAASLQQEWGLTNAQKGSLSSFAFLGLAIGTWLSGFMADKLGRRRVLILSYLGMGIVGVASAAAESFRVLAAMRLLNGMACGLGLPATFAMCSELFTKHKSASFALVAVSNTLGGLGAGFAMVLWIPDLVHGDWRAVTLAAAVPSFVFLPVAILLLPESPHWLVVHRRVEEAREILIRMGRMNGTLVEMEQLASRLEAESEQDGSPTKRASANEENAETPQDRSLLRDYQVLLSGWQPIKCVLICTFLCVVGNLLTFGMNYFWPAAMRHQAAGLGSATPALDLVTIALSGIPEAVAVLSVGVLPIGHRPVISTASMVTALALMWSCRELSTYGPHLLLAGGLSIAAGGTFYRVTLSFTSETFPTEVRGLAVGSCVTIGRIGCISAPMLVELLGLNYFLLLAAGSALAGGILVLPLQETKGLPLKASWEEAEAAVLAEATPLETAGKFYGSA